MQPMTRTVAAMMSGGRRYRDKVLSYGPIAYWPLWEQSGTTARCLVNPAQNGTYRDNAAPVDVSTWPVGTGIGDGNTAPTFGNNLRVDLYSATLNTAYNQAECTVCGWARITNAAIWADSDYGRVFTFYVDDNNTLEFNRNGGSANVVYFKEEAAATNKYPSMTAGPSTDWWHWAVAISESGDTIKVYLDGTQSGATQSGLGAWAGDLSSTATLLGQNTTTGTTASVQWEGLIAHVAIFSSALSAAEILNLAAV